MTYLDPGEPWNDGLENEPELTPDEEREIEADEDADRQHEAEHGGYDPDER